MVEKKELKRKLIHVWKTQAGKLVREKEFTKARQLLIDEAYVYFKESVNNTNIPKDVYLCHKNIFEAWQEFCQYIISENPSKGDNDEKMFARYIKRFSIDFYILNNSKKIGAYLHLKKLYE